MKRITSYKLTEKGMMSVDEVNLLKSCIARVDCEHPIIINIGAGVGTSVVAILEERPDSFIFSFDKKPKPEERQAVVEAGLDPSRCIRVLGNSWETGKKFPIQADIVFVDGAHHDEAVRKDIDTFLPKVKYGGYILFHDYDHRNLPGLTKIVDNRMKNYKRVGKARYLVAFEVCAD